MRLFCFVLFCIAHGLVLAQEEPEYLPGGAGQPAVLDDYNTEFSRWLHDYEPIEPQQIHLSMVSDGLAYRVQFSTLAPLHTAVFQYWPAVEEKPKVTSIWNREETWEFVDGGSEHRRQYMHIFKTQGPLRENTLYHYRIGSAKSDGNAYAQDIEDLVDVTGDDDGDDDGFYWSPKYGFHTHAKNVDQFSFMMAGDLGIVNAVTLRQMTSMAQSQHYDFFTYLGDFAYDMADMNGTKGNEFMNLLQDTFATTPLLTTPGNHESNYTFAHYTNRFRSVPYRESNSLSPDYYSVDYKWMHIVSITTEPLFEMSPESFETVKAWLRQDLARANANRAERPWIIVMGHRPLYCSSNDKAACVEDTNTLRQSGLEDILLEFSVDAYICGHRHNYERTYPVARGEVTSTSYKNAPSYFQLIIGNAGNYEQNKLFTSTPTEPLVTGPWSALRYAGYGLSTVSVTQNTLSFVHWQVEKDGSRGRPVDQFTAKKDKKQNDLFPISIDLGLHKKLERILE
ncbi:Metallo-dependent phosphatase-like protein [Syncephalastrum racemosum]|uniref:Purple acid phosphatase n=1 Tax=Syncephalastrum racemosum TaxID=13706 RepID=A0A1X2HDU7_SYNRA|nr:Metallo-dependent phosphatase-like protein [Syncephalastrum racemosum]